MNKYTLFTRRDQYFECIDQLCRQNETVFYDASKFKSVLLLFTVEQLSQKGHKNCLYGTYKPTLCVSGIRGKFKIFFGATLMLIFKIVDHLIYILMITAVVALNYEM